MMATQIKAHGTARRGLTARKNADYSSRSEFGPATFNALVEDLQTGRVPLDRVTVSDDVVPGLRAIIRKTGLVSYHVSYTTPDNSRPYLKIGDHPAMSLTKARQIARTVLSLADKGIDPQAGLHERLIRELDQQGDKWRP